MGVMDRFLNAIRLNSDEDEEYYEEEDYYDDMEYDEEEEEDDFEPRRRSFFGSRRDREDNYDYDDDAEEEEAEYETPRRTFASRSASQSSSSKVTPMRAVRRNSGSQSDNAMKVCVIKPISVEDAREITETLIANRTVILNLEGLDLEIAQRIIDFTSGSCYAISGNLQKISTYIFVVTPANVDISGDFQNIMGAFGGSSLQSDI